MTTKAAVLIFVAFVGAAGVHGAPAPVVHIDLIPARILPGLPVNLLISITNPGDEPVEIPNTARMHVTPPSGDPFVAVDDETYSPVDSFPSTESQCRA